MIFDKVVDRRATESMKWGVAGRPGDEDVIPMWVADMDFEAPPAVVEALERIERAVNALPEIPAGSGGRT